MNTTQIALLGAFEVAMQTVVEVYSDNTTTQIQLATAYGGAAALLILVQQNTDADKSASHAAMLLNQVAKSLGLPETN